MNFNLILIIVPILFGLLLSRICPISPSSAKNIKITPPSYVFGFVWPLLYLMIGISWYYTNSLSNNKYLNIPYLILLLLLLSWVIIYSCKDNKVNGVYVLFLTMLTIIITMILGNTYSRLFLSPFLVWILLATFINILEVESI